MRRSISFAVLAVTLLAFGARPAAALVTVETVVDDDRISATVTTPLYGLEVSLSFEEVVGLSVGSLGLSAEVVDLQDPDLLARLPAGVSVPAAFPILVAIEPPESGPLSFSGLATLELYTSGLEFTGGCPYRLFASHDGGTFEDVTDFMGTGSYRGRGRTGGFSDFLILADTRAVDDVVDTKLTRLWGLLSEHSSAIPTGVSSDLHDALSAVETAWNAGDPDRARSAVDDFSDVVEAASGSGVPDVWRSAGDLVNVAGELRAAAATLRFSLTLAG